MATCPAGYADARAGHQPRHREQRGGQFAAQGGAAPGVLAVFNTLFTNGPLGCAQSFGTAFAYGAGNQAASNNYNLSPGQPNSAWRVPVSQADCDVEYPAVGGGPSGFGLLEDNLANNTTIYHRFDQATEKFDTAPVAVSGQSELSPALSQDGAGGIYATYLSGGDGGPVGLAYSADGGKTFASASLNRRIATAARATSRARSTRADRAGPPGPTTGRCSRSHSRPRRDLGGQSQRQFVEQRVDGHDRRHLRDVPMHGDDRR